MILYLFAMENIHVSSKEINPDDLFSFVGYERWNRIRVAKFVGLNMDPENVSSLVCVFASQVLNAQSGELETILRWLLPVQHGARLNSIFPFGDSI